MKKHHLIPARFGAESSSFVPFVGLAIFVVVQAPVCSSRHTDNSFNLDSIFFEQYTNYSTCTLSLNFYTSMIICVSRKHHGDV